MIGSPSLVCEGGDLSNIKIEVGIATLYIVSLLVLFNEYCADNTQQLVWTVVEDIGVEPMTSCVQGRRSSQLS